MDIINGLVADQALTALVVTVVLLTAADLLTGIAAAVARKTFALAQVADFIATHVVGRVLPIVGVGVLGHFETSLFALAAAAAAAYALETLGSIRANLLLPPATS